MRLGSEVAVVEGIEAFYLVRTKELEEWARSGECPDVQNQAHKTAISMTIDLLSQIDTGEARKFTKTLSPPESTPELLSPKRFIGGIALLAAKYHISNLYNRDFMLDASNPEHFPLAVEGICNFAMRSVSASRGLVRQFRRTVAIAQIASNRDVL